MPSCEAQMEMVRRLNERIKGQQPATVQIGPHRQHSPPERARERLAAIDAMIHGHQMARDRWEIESAADRATYLAKLDRPEQVGLDDAAERAIAICKELALHDPPGSELAVVPNARPRVRPPTDGSRRD